MKHPVKVALVTLGMMGAGAVFGAVAAIVAFIVAVTFTHGTAWIREAQVLLLVGMVGALFGGFLFPSAIWIFLRRVPFGLALLGMVVGTVLGGTVGWLAFVGPDVPINAAMLGAFVGFVVSCVALRVGVPRLQRVRAPAA